jgi:DNA mismatch repair protein MutH
VKIVTRATAVANLTAYIGQDLRALAAEHGITTYETGRQNKGWKGQILERLAGLENSNTKAPNGLTFELKSVSFHYVKSELVAKETMAITMINPTELRQNSFFESHCWSKLKTMIFCAVMWHGRNSENAELLQVASLDFSETDELIREIQTDYEFIRQKLIEHGFASLTGADGKWMQARTKGAGHGSTSRAFYARKRLVKKIFEMADATNAVAEKLAA